MRVHSSSPFVQ